MTNNVWEPLEIGLGVPSVVFLSAQLSFGRFAASAPMLGAIRLDGLAELTFGIASIYRSKPDPCLTVKDARTRLDNLR